MKRHRTPPRYFDDRIETLRRLALGAGMLSAFVLVYTLGTLIGILQP